MRAATVLLPAPAGPSMATISGEFWFSFMLLASYALAYAADSRPVTCLLVFHPAYRLVSHPVFRQTCLLVFHPVCYQAALGTSLSAATVSPVGRKRLDALSGSRRRGETKAEAGGWKDSWCAGHRFVPRVVHRAVVTRVQIQARLVLVPFLVSILVRNVRVPVLVPNEVQISQAPIHLV
jgi:hypothetical protein